MNEGVTRGGSQDVAEQFWKREEPSEEEVKDRDGSCEQVTTVDGSFECLLRDLGEDFSNTKSHIQVFFNIN